MSPRTTEEQDQYDVMLDKAMNDAAAAAGEIVALGNLLVEGREEFINTILPQVQEAYQKPYESSALMA